MFINVIFMRSDIAYYVFMKNKPFNEHICHWLYFLGVLIARYDATILFFQELGDSKVRTSFRTAKHNNKEGHAAECRRLRLFNYKCVDAENEHLK